MASGAVFFVTLNEGYEYVGTNPMNEALRDRMTYAVCLGYVPKKVEKAILTRRTGVDDETAAAAWRWVTAVNNDGQYVCWQYAVVSDPSKTGAVVREAVGRFASK